MADEPLFISPMSADYWRTHRCPWCGAAGLFVHVMEFAWLECDACGTGWKPEMADG